MRRLVTTSLLATILVASPMIAAAQQPSPEGKTPESTQQQLKMPKKDQSRAPTARTLEFLMAQQDSDWLAKSLIGRPVQNAKGEKLGNINDLVLDQQGQIVAALIGVGGFLGIGEKDVAVRYDALEFKRREIKRPPVRRDARDDAFRKSTRLGTPGSDPSRVADRREPQRQPTPPPAPRKDADHSDMVIVLNATPEQLEAAPAFKRIGETEKPAAPKSTPPERKGPTQPPQPKAQ